MRGAWQKPEHLYQPFYCEENVWHLVQDPSLIDGNVWIITNPTREVAMLRQKAASPIAWDYHVVCATRTHVYDLDSTLAGPPSIAFYLSESFPVSQVAPNFAPTFRVMNARTFVDRFGSDRSHMRSATGEMRHPAPAWPAIYPERAGFFPHWLNLEVPLEGARDLAYPEMVKGWGLDA